jgi:ribokinase
MSKVQTKHDHKPVVVVGSINADLTAQVERIPRSGQTVLGSDFRIFPGGKGANQAVAVARLGYPVCMIGKLGASAFADLLRNSLSVAGVDVSAVQTVEGASGVALIAVDLSGENSIVVAPGANSLVLPEDVDANFELIRSAGIVLVQLEIPLATVAHLVKVCARVGVPVVLDPAPANDLPVEVLSQVAWFTPNESEALFYIHDDTAGSHSPEQQKAEFLRRGISGVVLKRGQDGVLLANQSGLEAAVPAFPANVVDTTAAGDAFNGAFATGLMLGKSPVESARFACAAASISVSRAGAQPSMATREETEEVLARYPAQ